LVQERGLDLSVPSVIYARGAAVGDDPANILRSLFDDVGGWFRRIRRGDGVLIKPNFVAPFPEATTDLAFLAAVLERIRDAGGIPIVGESSGFEFDTDMTFKILGAGRFCRDLGVELVDLEKRGFRTVDLGRGLGRTEIAEAALEADWIVGLPVLKGHSITGISGAVKNLFGLLSKPSRRRLHAASLDRGIRALGRRFENSVHFVDARRPLSRAVFGDARALGLCLAGTDAFALDRFGAGLLGLDPARVRHLGPAGPYRIEGAPPEPSTLPIRRPERGGRARRLLYRAAFLVDEIKCRSIGGESWIPSLHWRFGVRPALGEISADEIERLSRLCPAGAIDPAARKIVKERCMKVRCLVCHRSASARAVVLKGPHPPAGEGGRG
jgi:uncharacterized protein (DUF362 family)